MTGLDTVNEPTPMPNDGDVAICLYCNHIHVFEGGQLRNATQQERDEVALDPDIMETLQFNRMYQKLFPKRRGT